jgi:hypothetical protein
MTMTTRRHDKSALIGALENAGAAVNPRGAVKCPFHDDRHASGSLYESGGIWRFKCHACDFGGDLIDVLARSTGCTPAEILRRENPAPSLRRQSSAPRVYRDLEKAIAGIPGTLEARYDYRHPVTEQAELIIARFRDGQGGKTFRQFHPVAGGYLMKAPPKPWPLYNRKRILESESVIVVEGEKCVHLLAELGIVATTSPCGAGKAEHADWSPLAGRQVFLWPDNDASGAAHMDDVAACLQGLDPTPDVQRLAAGYVRPGGDAEEFVAPFETVEDKKAAVMKLLEKVRRLRPSQKVSRLLMDTVEGNRRTIEWPWSKLTYLTRALLPGTLTLLAGPPVSAKSLLLLESLRYWHDTGVRCAALMLEEDQAFHLNRAVAQKLSDSRVLDDDWVRQNAEWTLARFGEQLAWLDDLGLIVQEPATAATTLGDVKKWLTARAKEGCRVIAVDPLTIASGQSGQTWIEDQRFMQAVQNIARRYDCSIILVTHPRKNRKGLIGLDEIAGGAAFVRFAQCVIWLEQHQPAKLVDIKADTGGILERVKVNRSAYILKARNARGTGLIIGLNLDGESLTFTEAGVIQPAKG